MVETIITQNFTFGGNCSAKIKEKIVFVPFSLPNETLEVEILEENKNYNTAKILKVLNPSPHRVLPICPYYGVCGGCNMMHIESKFQTELRKDILKDFFENEGLVHPEIEVIAGNSLGYRNRFELNNGGLSIRASNEIVPIEKCECAIDGINRYLAKTPLNERPKGRCHIFSQGNEVIIAQDKKDFNISNHKKHNIHSKKRAQTKFEGINSLDVVRANVKLCNKNLTFDARGFFQSNLEVLEKSISVITGGFYEQQSVLDMYSGCGTFSVFLADTFKNVVMVEHNKGAAVCAEENMQGKNHENYAISGAKWVKENAPNIIKQNGIFNAALIDPPRQGMEKEVLLWLCKSGIPQIRSLSCNPKTHAKDVAILCQNGYKIKRLFLLDFYPQTSHIESLAYLEKL